MGSKKIRNIALFAHVDAGKTSISEQFLFHSGKIKTKGSVDKGSAQTDFLEVEKERGITVNSTILTFFWKKTQINLIDTPGHIDFSSETEKAIQAIDSAIIVISAIEGIQAQTERMIELLQKHQKPFLIFVNKIDRNGADSELLLSELENELKLNLFPIQNIIDEGNELVSIKNIWKENTYNDSKLLLEKLLEYDENLFEAYFENKTIKWEDLDSLLTLLIQQKEISLVLFGSAKKTVGIHELLDAIATYLPDTIQQNKNLMGVVFKTIHQKSEGKLSAIRLFGGTINSRDIILNTSKSEKNKVRLIKNTNLQQQAIIQSFGFGEIAWVQGLESAEPGDYIGISPSNCHSSSMIYH